MKPNKNTFQMHRQKRNFPWEKKGGDSGRRKMPAAKGGKRDRGIAFADKAGSHDVGERGKR